MSEYLDQPVSTIHGIGEVTETRLREFGLFVISDLLRVSVPRLQTIVDDLASDEESYDWQRQAELLQISGMTPAHALAMIEIGLDSIERIAWANSDDSIALLSEHQGEENPPTEFEDIVRDAIRLHHSGILRGTLNDSIGSALPNVEVSIGRYKQVTDARGRFNLTGIHPATPAVLTVAIQDETTARFTELSLVYDQRLVKNQVFTIQPELIIASELDEYEGDIIEDAHLLEMTSKQFPAEEVRDGDLLTVQSLYADNQHAKVYSQYKRMLQGKLVVRTHKLPLVDLGDSQTEKGAHYLVKGDSFKSITLTQYSLPIYRKLRRVYRNNPDFSQPIESAEDFIARLERFNEEV